MPADRQTHPSPKGGVQPNGGPTRTPTSPGDRTPPPLKTLLIPPKPNKEQTGTTDKTDKNKTRTQLGERQETGQERHQQEDEAKTFQRQEREKQRADNNSRNVSMVVFFKETSVFNDTIGQTTKVEGNTNSSLGIVLETNVSICGMRAVRQFNMNRRQGSGNPTRAANVVGFNSIHRYRRRSRSSKRSRNRSSSMGIHGGASRSR